MKNTPHSFRFLIIVSFFVMFLLFGGLQIVSSAACNLTGDIDCSGKVTNADLSQLLAVFGSANSTVDLNKNGTTDVTDLLLLLSNFGRSPSSATPTPVQPTITPIIGYDPSFSCLDNPGPLEVVSGFYNSGKFEPNSASNKKFDARNASFEIPKTISHSMIAIDGGGNADNMCWAGGYVTASRTWHDLNISWDQSKHGDDNSGSDRGEMENTTSATSYENRMTWTGLHVFNVHDGLRTSNSFENWKIQHVWLDYIRDDCVENDHIYSGGIYDSLFDGCYSGISVRPSSTGVGNGSVIKLDKVLLRMEPMPYPYKWDSKSDPTLKVSGYGDTPFGYGSVFKMDSGNEPDFEITNTVFLLEYNSKKEIFPPKEKVKVCSNNTIIWMGDPADTPYYLTSDFPGCFTIINNKVQGKALWKNLVTDWHNRHPGVGANRKPANPGEYKWPRY